MKNCKRCATPLKKEDIDETDTHCGFCNRKTGITQPRTFKIGKTTYKPVSIFYTISASIIVTLFVSVGYFHAGGEHLEIFILSAFVFSLFLWGWLFNGAFVEVRKRIEN